MARPRKQPGVLVAVETFAAGDVVVHAGDRVRADDPLAKGREKLFRAEEAPPKG